MLQLARAYVILTVLGSLLIVPGTVAITGSSSLALSTGALLFCQSSFNGYEYWALAGSDVAYDRYLRSSGLVQALLSLFAPATLLLSKSPAIGVASLALSYGVPILLIATAQRFSSVRALRRVRVRPRAWVSDAATVAVGSVSAAVFYGLDIFVLRELTGAAHVADYRLSVTVMAFIVGLIPLSLFLLADVSAAKATRWVGVVVVAGISVSVAWLAAWLLPMTSQKLGVVGATLTWLAPLSAIRILSQVMSSELHGRGAHRSVAIAFTLGIGAWGIAFLSLTHVHAISLPTMAIAQTAVEVAVLLALCSLRGLLALRTRLTGQNYGRVSPVDQ